MCPILAPGFLSGTWKQNFGDVVRILGFRTLHLKCLLCSYHEDGLDAVFSQLARQLDH